MVASSSLDSKPKAERKLEAVKAKMIYKVVQILLGGNCCLRLDCICFSRNTKICNLDINLY